MTLDRRTELSTAETDALLARHETGVLALASDDEPYAIPVSYGYESDDGRVRLRLATTPESAKRQFLGEAQRARLVVYEERDGAYESVVATGRLVEVPRDELTAADVERYGSAKRPLFEIWSESPSDLDIRLYRLEPTDIAGHRVEPADGGE